jgi:6-pyruvoyl-tetrahydropterin synthase
MVMDFVDLKAVVQPIIDRLDHQHLGNGSVLVHYGRLDCTEVERTVHLPSTVGGLQLENPTSEALILWIASELPRNFPWYDMTLNETCTSACTLHREEYEYGYNQKASNAQASATRPQAPEAALDQDSYKEARVTHHVTEARVTAFKDTVEGMA